MVVVCRAETSCIVYNLHILGTESNVLAYECLRYSHEVRNVAVECFVSVNEVQLVGVRASILHQEEIFSFAVLGLPCQCLCTVHDRSWSEWNVKTFVVCLAIRSLIELTCVRDFVSSECCWAVEVVTIGKYYLCSLLACNYVLCR